MVPNLCQQYRDVLFTLDNIHEFEKGLFKRVKYRAAFSLLKARLRSGKRFGENWRLTGGYNLEALNLLTNTATAQDKKNPLYSACIAEFPFHSECEFLLFKHPDVNFGLLYEFHSQRVSSEFLDKKKMLGFILAAGTLLLKDVPESLINKWLTVSYIQFQEAVFGIAIFTAVYLLFISSAFDWLLPNPDERRREFGRTLHYISLLQSAKTRSTTASSHL